MCTLQVNHLVLLRMYCTYLCTVHYFYWYYTTLQLGLFEARRDLDLASSLSRSLVTTGAFLSPEESGQVLSDPSTLCRGGITHVMVDSASGRPLAGEQLREISSGSRFRRGLEKIYRPLTEWCAQGRAGATGAKRCSYLKHNANSVNPFISGWNTLRRTKDFIQFSSWFQWWFNFWTR